MSAVDLSGSKLLLLLLLPWLRHWLWLRCNFMILLLSFFTFCKMTRFYSSCTGVVSSQFLSPRTVPSLLPSRDWPRHTLVNLSLDLQ